MEHVPRYGEQLGETFPRPPRPVGGAFAREAPQRPSFNHQRGFQRALSLVPLLLLLLLLALAPREGRSGRRPLVVLSSPAEVVRIAARHARRRPNLRRAAILRCVHLLRSLEFFRFLSDFLSIRILDFIGLRQSLDDGFFLAVNDIVDSFAGVAQELFQLLELVLAELVRRRMSREMDG